MYIIFVTILYLTHTNLSSVFFKLLKLHTLYSVMNEQSKTQVNFYYSVILRWYNPSKNIYRLIDSIVNKHLMEHLDPPSFSSDTRSMDVTQPVFICNRMFYNLIEQGFKGFNCVCF